jgi:DNA-binding transcriptional MerR regulator
MSYTQLDIFAQLETEIAVESKKTVAPAVQDKLYHSITEVAKIFDVNASLLRFWEKEFPQIKLRKNGKGDRLYTKENIQLIHTIHYLTKTRKFTLEGTREYLKKDKYVVAKEGELVQQLQEVKSFLKGLKKALS